MIKSFLWMIVAVIEVGVVGTLLVWTLIKVWQWLRSKIRPTHEDVARNQRARATTRLNRWA